MLCIVDIVGGALPVDGAAQQLARSNADRFVGSQCAIMQDMALSRVATPVATSRDYWIRQETDQYTKC
jgi:hypothetical protein